MDILLTAGLPWPTILYTVLIDEIMIITGLVGALVTSSYKVQYIVIIKCCMETLLIIIIVGILHLWMLRSLLGWVDPHLDRPQARSCHWFRCLENLPHGRYLDHLPLVPLSNCLGPFRGWQCHLT